MPNTSRNISSLDEVKFSLIFSIHPSYYEWDNPTRNFSSNQIEIRDGAPSLQPDFPYNGGPMLPFKLHGQALQDMIVLEIFQNQNDGFFVDLTTND